MRETIIKVLKKYFDKGGNMKNIGEIKVRNRPLVHYLLSLLSFSLQGVDEIHLKSYGSLIGKATDIANLLTRNLLPDTFTVDSKNSIERVKSPSIYGRKKRCNASVSTICLKFLRPVAPLIERTTPSTSDSESRLEQINIFELEFLIAMLNRAGLRTLQLSIESIDYKGGITPFDLDLVQLDLAPPRAIFGKDVVNPSNTLQDVASSPKSDKTRVETERRVEKLMGISSALDDALIRAGVLIPDLESHKFHISLWDDIILGLDTNLFYQGAPTAYILDSLMKIPSGDFIDTPDWVTLVVSKVSVAEIEHRAHRGATTWDRRESLRAIQEIMLLNRSKDLEGVSLFLVGDVPPGVDFSKPEATTTMRDFLIREHFRTFLKQLDFYKGSYFATADFDNATLAEAEGLTSLYIKKPVLSDMQYELPTGGINTSELIYELAVAFEPLVIKGDSVKLLIHSNWKGKTLENWENLDIRVEWIEDQLKLQPRFDELRKRGAIANMLMACQNLKYRFVSWAR